MGKNNTTSSSEVASLTEHLSALLDGEAGSFEQRRVLDELRTDDKLRQKISSYSLIGETIRSGQITAVAGTSFLAGIHDKIDSEPEYDQIQLEDKNAENKKSNSWLRPVGGFALAASVVAVAFIGIQNYQQTETGLVTASVENTAKPQKDKLTVAEMNSATVVSADKTIANDQVATVAPDLYSDADSQTRLLLKRYVDGHLQRASVKAFVPSVRVIAFAD